MERTYRPQEKDLIFALDIGTRSIIGVVGKMEGSRLNVLAIEREEHDKRAMIDGQIEDIAQVARIARIVTERLEERMQTRLTRVCVAAAGRALKTTSAHFELELPEVKTIDEELIGQLEAGAVSAAEESLATFSDDQRRFFLVGYTVSQYRLDHYPMSTIRDHRGKLIEADIVGTFLPSEVVESLYSAMRAANLEIVSLTLEPIAAMNAAVPADLRLLNLVLADIGAGTSDIAVCRDGSVVGYTMATLAGDEITESLMRTYLVDFKTAERLKQCMEKEGSITFTDILGFEQSITAQEITDAVQNSEDLMAGEIAKKIVEVNGGAPSALFLAGGGSKLSGLRETTSKYLDMDLRRIAVAGSNFERSAFSTEHDLNNPEYATPLGIAISAGMGLINDSYVVTLNGENAKLFRNGTLTVQEILLMNGYTYADMLGRTGGNLTVTINGQKAVFRGKSATPALLRVNGEEVAVTTLVYAGDEITFIPATHGENATRTLGDVLEPGFSGSALINGKECPFDTILHSGDEISTIVSAAPAEPVAPAAPIADAAPVAPAAPGALVAPVVPAAPVAPVVPVAPVAQPAEEEVLFARYSDDVYYAPTPAPTPAPAAPIPEPILEPEPTPVREREKLSITLNDRRLLLDEKANGEPYYLMDLLEHTDIDFNHLQRPVALRVNGAAGMFQQRIMPGDEVVIRYEDLK